MQIWDAHVHTALCQVSMVSYRAVVHIHLHEDEVGMLKTQLFEHWCHHLAWAAPGSGEVCNYLRSKDTYVAVCISLNVTLSKVWLDSSGRDRAAQ